MSLAEMSSRNRVDNEEKWQNNGRHQELYKVMLLWYSQTCIERSPFGSRKSGLIRQMWPFNTSDYLIELSAWTGVTSILCISVRFEWHIFFFTKQYLLGGEIRHKFRKKVNTFAYLFKMHMQQDLLQENAMHLDFYTN